MKIILLTFVYVFFAPRIMASCHNSKSYKEGKSFGKQQKSKEEFNAAKKEMTSKIVPGYKGTDPKQAGYANQAASLKSKADQKMRNCKPGSALEAFQESVVNKSEVYLDAKDPMFTEADAAVKNPLAILEAEEEQLVDNTQVITSTHTCQESGHDTVHVCHEHLVVESVRPPPAAHMMTLYVRGFGSSKTQYDCINRYETSHKTYHSGAGHHIISTNPGLDMTKVEKIISFAFDGPFQHVDAYYRNASRKGLRHTRVGWRDAITINNNGIVKVSLKRRYPGGTRKYHDEILEGRVAIKVTYQPKPFEVTERHVNYCQELKEKSRKGICVLRDEKPDLEPATRLIDGIPVTRNWWGTTKTYSCAYPSVNNCEQYRMRGCTQVGMRCIKAIDNQCVDFEKTFECIEETRNGKRVAIKGGAYCLDGNCNKQVVAANKNMAEAISKLAMLKDIHKDCNIKDMKVFKGEALGCKDSIAGYKGCCDLEGGWGKTFGSVCSAMEQALWNHRKEKRCKLVGTYCAEKVLGVCIAERTQYCCFESRMALLLQKQGRRQLGISWGTPEEPNCRSLTLHEFARIDFTKINFSALFKEFKAKLKIKEQDKKALVGSMQQHWEQQLPDANSLQEGKIDSHHTMEHRIRVKHEKDGSNAGM